LIIDNKLVILLTNQKDYEDNTNERPFLTLSDFAFLYL
jgi:hypothetical protein